ncbi:glutathione S-transferase [Rhodospirillales bacterium 47_12_T64]|nr:glutathione S-transferase [Rhodospirillales bacterium 47_12_T64]
MSEPFIYHVCKKEEFTKALKTGRYEGSSQDRVDGFIHFSSREQVHGSVVKHRAGQDNLTLLEVDTSLLGSELVWELSRGGQLFPHLYGPLPISSITRTAALLLQKNGAHNFPEWLPELSD